MKKLFFFFSILSFLNFVSLGQQSSKNDLTVDELKGKVKTLKEYVYEAVKENDVEKKSKLEKSNIISYNVNGFYTEYSSYDSNSKLINKRVYFYDNQNNLVEKKTFIKDEKLYEKSVYSYDDKKKLIEEKIYNSEGKLDRTIKYDYNNKGLLVAQSVYNYGYSAEESITKNEFEYDSKGNLIVDKYYYKGELDNKVVYKYNNKNLCIKEITYDADNKIISEIKNSYDNKSRLNKIVKYGRNNILLDEETRKYDNYNNMIEAKNNYVHINMKYEYDKKGNWIKQIFYENNALREIIEREIEYYD